ncbi:proteoglycan 4-like isoform X2 [Sinocyclocheilus rhinocerous]|uniref:proteoglycan 4-like isoform X2 n=1 Tax=Sinocyclocheilus rhinocerous TaxID=307959 RepID=UPI0007B87CBB|nr:PREDICTED: proteoglycan 4-like isoform X2 [Sinocyclocheilus rhinocerous]
MTTYLSLLLLFAYASASSSDQSSCRGRCGEGYYRGSLCQCDYECLSLNECCTDFTELCTTKDSCKGRCWESFNRDNLCHCDIDCVSYNQCCTDYESMCLVEGEELTFPEDESESTPSEGLDASTILPAVENPTEHVPNKTPSSPVPVKPTKNPTQPSIENDKSEPKETHKDPSDIAPIRPAEKPLNPTSDKNGKTDSIKDYQDDYDTNLCSGRPVSDLTTLRNGTIVVFRGHYFWTLDKHRNPDPPQLITSVWGIPSPIDTVYTRCSCQGKTYFFKGKNYWRFENGLMDPGFPKPISTGFGQIGHITAALSIPKYRSRKESVIFFKRGGMAQKYTYQVTPNCVKKPRIPMLTVRTRARRQAAAALGQVINISKTWRGFPTMVTSAVSVPSRVKEEYKYYIFSQNNYHSIKMEREKPVILKPATGPKENQLL